MREEDKLPENLFGKPQESREPSAFCMNNQFDLFGKKINIITSERRTYPRIQDDPVELGIPKVSKNSWLKNLAVGLVVTAGLACLAVATVATGGTALAVCACAGGAIGAGIVTASAIITDIKRKDSRSLGEFLGQLVLGAVTGAMTGAMVGGLVETVPLAAELAGVQASMITGGTSHLTTAVVPNIVKAGGYSLATLNGVFGVNQAFTVGSGTDVLLEHVFQGNVEVYESSYMAMQLLSMSVMQYGSQMVGAPKEGTKEKKQANTKSTKGIVEKKTAGTGTVGAGSSRGGSSSEVYIPKDADGNPIALRKQNVNGQDIPLPDPAAEGRPHTVLGGKICSKTGDVYRQSATFPEGTWPTANGQNVPWSEVHWTDHGTLHHHTNPHQHIFEYNPDKGGWIRKGPTSY